MIVVATDIHLVECGGEYYLPSQLYSIMKNYYEAFGKITVLSRGTHTDDVSGLSRTSDIVEGFFEIKSLKKTLLGRYDRDIENTVKNADIVVCRCPSMIGYHAAALAHKHGVPVYTESMACAWDGYWNHGLSGKILAPYMFLGMRKTVREADFALYVTNEFLQKRYPCRCESVAVSNVKVQNIDEQFLTNRIERINSTDYKTLNLVTTAAIDVRYKGQEYVIKAIPKLNKMGIRVMYRLIGGNDPTFLTEVAKSCGVLDQVCFMGRRSLDEVFEIINNSDIYIQPSLQEGLPRSVIEAMSRACPVIGARTAGIPELISDECVVKRKSSDDIVRAIAEIYNASKMTELAKKNFEESKKYSDDILSARRSAYYKAVKEKINEKDKR